MHALYANVCNSKLLVIQLGNIFTIIRVCDFTSFTLDSNLLRMRVKIKNIKIKIILTHLFPSHFYIIIIERLGGKAL